MIVCPLCEHAQAQGELCEQCGRQLAPAWSGEVSVAPLGELEVTRHARAQVAAAPLAELEVTRQPSGPVASVTLPELERTGLPAAAAVATAPIADLELGRAAPEGVKTPYDASAATCRYCGNVQPAGTLCDKCGMRLPKLVVAALAPPESAGVGEFVMCKCGVRAKTGSVCSSCGQRLAPASP